MPTRKSPMHKWHKENNAVFVDAERDGENWLKEWREEQSRFKLLKNRLKRKNLVLWDPNKEA